MPENKICHLQLNKLTCFFFIDTIYLLKILQVQVKHAATFSSSNRSHKALNIFAHDG